MSGLSVCILGNRRLRRLLSSGERGTLQYMNMRDVCFCVRGWMHGCTRAYSRREFTWWLPLRRAAETSSRLRDQAASHVHNKDELLMLAARVIVEGF